MTTEALDIQTEEVHNAVVVTESGPTQVPIKFDVTQAAIAKMYKHARTLTITGPDDKDGFNAVYQYRQMVKQQRVRVQKKQKELKAPHTQYNRDVDAEAKKLTESMDEIEEGLSAKEKTYNDERERIAEEKAKAERVRLEGRVEQIRSSCFKYNAETDTYGFDEVIINLDDLKTLSDEEYAPTAELILTTQQKEADRLAEVKRLEDLEKKRIADEQEVERKRIVAENNRLAEERAELQRKADALDALTLKARATALINVGFVFESGVYNNPDQNSYWRPAKLLLLTDEQFDKLIEDTVAANQKREDARIQAEKDEAQRIKDEKKAILDKQRADKVRQERLRSDKKVLAKFLKEHGTPKVPATTQEESAYFMYQYCVRVKELKDEFTAMLEVL